MSLINFILLFIIFILLFLLFLLKKQIRLVTKQILEYSIESDTGYITLALFDKYLNSLVTEINNLISRHKKLKIKIYRQNNQLKDSIAYISHDLRTPLTSIIGYLQLLEKSNLDEKQIYNLNIALKKCETLKKLQSEFFELSTLESNDVVAEFIKLNITNIVSDVLLENIQLFEKANITPQFELPDKPVYILANETMVRRIIQNLITNSITYSNGYISIKLDIKDGIIFNIINDFKDTNKCNTDNLFKKFYTGDSSRSNSGTGLGLAIVKLLIEKLDGSVSAQSIDNMLEISVSFIKY